MGQGQGQSPTRRQERGAETVNYSDWRFQFLATGDARLARQGNLERVRGGEGDTSLWVRSPVLRAGGCVK